MQQNRNMSREIEGRQGEEKRGRVRKRQQKGKKKKRYCECICERHTV